MVTGMDKIRNRIDEIDKTAARWAAKPTLAIAGPRAARSLCCPLEQGYQPSTAAALRSDGCGSSTDKVVEDTQPEVEWRLCNDICALSFEP